MEAFAETYAENSGLDDIPIDGEEERLFSRYACHIHRQTLPTILSCSEEEDELFDKYFMDMPE